MSDNFLDKLGPIKELLQNPEAQEKLKSIMEYMNVAMPNMNSQGATTPNPSQISPMPQNPISDAPLQQPQPQQQQNQQPVQNAFPKASINLEETMNTIIRIKQAYDRVSNAPDNRVNLLLALRPYMSSKRSNKIDTAIQMVHLTKISKMMNEM